MFIIMKLAFYVGTYIGLTSAELTYQPLAYSE